MKTKLLAFLVALIMVFSLTACGTSQQAGQTPSGSEISTRIFTDDLGRDVEVPVDISRILPSSLLSQIILYSIAPDLFVGLASDRNETARGIIADEYLDLPYYGSLSAGSDLNVEELALAAPQLIIDIGEPKDSIREDMDALQAQTLIPSVFISYTLDTMPQTYRTLGKLLGREARGEELAQFCERTYQRTLEIMDRVGENKVNCLLVLGEEGLNVIAATSYHAELLDLLTNNLAVVDNPLAKGTGNEVTMEQIALWNPEFILFDPGSIYETVDNLPTWDQISAVANRNYVEIPETPYNWMGMPPSAQRYLALIWMPAVLYPEYCDYDVESEIKAYFQLFYNCTLTDEQYASITANAFLR